MAACTYSSFFVAEGGRLMSYGNEDNNWVRDVIGVEVTGVLGNVELDANDPAIPTLTLLPSIAGIRISSVSAGIGFNAAVSAAGKGIPWASAADRQLGGRPDRGRPSEMSGWSPSRPTWATPLRPHAMAACSAGAVWKGSACQKLPPLCTRKMVCVSSCLHIVTHSCRACRAAKRPHTAARVGAVSARPSRRQPIGS